MNAKDLTLNIAVNLGRLGRWVAEGKTTRVSQFLTETENYVQELEVAPKNEKFQPTFNSFKKEFQRMRNNVQLNDEWAEKSFTWANILTHRAKLA